MRIGQMGEHESCHYRGSVEPLATHCRIGAMIVSPQRLPSIGKRIGVAQGSNRSGMGFRSR
jgi:hypothetical protein